MKRELGSRPKVGVIGGGVSGIVTAKELKEVGIECECFEMMPVLGGVFAHYGWKDGRLTSSSVFTWFSDFPMKDRQKHLTWEEWVDYLNRYAVHFGIIDQFRFNCKVVDVKQCSEGGYDLTIHKRNWSNGHSSHGSQEKVEEEIFTTYYDYLVIGSGLHHTPNLPKWSGVDSFRSCGGTLLHSSKFRDAAEFKGKNVVVVGAGESGSDITYHISNVAKKTYSSMRSGTGVLFPDKANGYTADIRDNRIVWSFPRALWPLVVASQAKFFRTVNYEPAQRAKVFKMAADMNVKNRASGFNINSCKSFGIPEAIIYNNAEIKPNISHFSGKSIHFTDGSVVDEVDAVIAATGYQMDINAIKDKDLKEKFSNPRLLWKNMMAIDQTDLFIVGFTRPQNINLVTCCELQARTIALIVSGQKSVPSEEEMKSDILKHIEHMQRTFSRGSKTLVDFHYYADGLAQWIGCAPDFVSTLLTDPMMVINMVFAPFCPCQYRLVGPGATPSLARDAIMASPYYQHHRERLARDMSGFFLLLTTGVWSLFGIGEKHMRPVGLAGKLFEFFAALWLGLIIVSIYFQQFPVSLLLLFPILVFSKALRSGTSEKMLEESEPLLLKFVQSKYFLFNRSKAKII